MEKYVYAIPSYNRVNRQTTLEYLKRIGVPSDRIFIFVQTNDDFAAYTAAHANSARIVMAPATRGVEARNNILNRLRDENIIMLDDDIRHLYYLTGNKLVAFETRMDLAFAFNRCFDQARNLGTGIFGIYPVDNAFFMSQDISTKVTVNTVFGFVKAFPFRFDEHFDTKEDAEICGRILKAGGRVARFNNLAVNADHRKDANGYIDDWHQEENLRSVKQLCQTHPEIFTPQSKKPWEVRVIIKDDKHPAMPFRAVGRR